MVDFAERFKHDSNLYLDRSTTTQPQKASGSRHCTDRVHTVRGQIRVPTVILAVNYAKVPKKRPKLSQLNIGPRVICYPEISS